MKVQIISIENDPSVSEWEEVPDEDLWEDGELGAIDVSQKLFQRIVNTGEWKLIRRKQ